METEIRTEELKQLELGVLCYIRDKCRENGLKYYLMYGTLIGAVRHKGFIPWDDDVDIAMFRADFMKLLSAIGADTGSHYAVLSMYNVPDYPFSLAKVVDTRTRLVQHGVIGTHEKLGAYVDIFLIDAVPDDDRAYDQLVRRVRTCSRRCYLSQRKLVLRKGQLVKDLCLALVSLPYKLFCPVPKAIRKLDRVSASYESNPTKRAGIFMDTFNQKESTLTREQWADTVEMEFEGEEFTAPACYDELLRRLQRALHVAFVAPQKKCHSCHRHRCFIILLTESAKWVNTIVGLPFCAICATALSISAISGSMFREPTKGANFEQKASSSPHR